MKNITYQEFESNFDSVIGGVVENKESITITGHEKGDFVIVPYAEFNEIQERYLQLIAEVDAN